MLAKITITEGKWYHHLIAWTLNTALYMLWAGLVGVFITQTLVFWDYGSMDLNHIAMSTFMAITAQLVYSFVTDKDH